MASINDTIVSAVKEAMKGEKKSKDKHNIRLAYPDNVISIEERMALLSWILYLRDALIKLHFQRVRGCFGKALVGITPCQEQVHHLWRPELYVWIEPGIRGEYG